MAEAIPAALPPTVSAECGFCLRSDADLVNPKQMSCSHVHCLECLTAAYNINKIVRCPTCRRVYDVSLDSLSSVFIPDSSTYCDICRRKEVTNQPAVVYCTSCCKTYCSKHLELHDGLLDDHPKVTIDEYRAKARQFKPRKCTEHVDEVYSLSCKSCLNLFCVKCVPGLGTCPDGSSHQLISIDELVSELQKTLNNLKVEVMDKEGELSALLKRTSKYISDYEMETGEMISLIRKTRNAQLEAVTAAYKELETEFVKQRKTTQSVIARFMENELDEKLSSLCNQRLRLEVRMKDNHQVDVISGYRETREEINRLIDEGLPKLCLNDSVKLQTKGVSKSVELEIVLAEDINICFQSEETTLTKPPQTLTLIHFIEMDCAANTVHQYDGKTYVGQGSHLQVMDENFQLHEKLFTNSDWLVFGVAVFNNRIYSLLYNYDVGQFKVSVYELEGQFINQWKHRDHGNYSFAVVNSQLVIPCRSTMTLSVYSLTGQLVKQIPCPQLTADLGHGGSVCSATGSDVIVSDYYSSRVFRVDINTEEVKWTLTDLDGAECVTCYGEGYVVVYREGQENRGIAIVDVNTGELHSQLNLENESNVYDMHISGDTLAVACDDGVRWYRIE